MKRLRMIALGVLGVVLPITLVFSAYLIVRGSIGSADAVPPVPQHQVSDDGAPSLSPSASPTKKDDRSGKDVGVSDDHGGGSSGSGSSGSGSSGSDSSGKGGGDDSPDSSRSGHGGGDD